MFVWLLIHRLMPVCNISQQPQRFFAALVLWQAFWSTCLNEVEPKFLIICWQRTKFKQGPCCHLGWQNILVFCAEEGGKVGLGVRKMYLHDLAGPPAWLWWELKTRLWVWTERREQKPLQIKRKKCHLWMEEVFCVAKPKPLNFPPSPYSDTHSTMQEKRATWPRQLLCSAAEWKRPPPARGVGLLVPREGLTHPVFESVS